MDQRQAFLVEQRRGLYTMQDAQSDRFTMAELCARHGVSRKTGYKWITRYAEEGRRGLGDRSRAPQTCPHGLVEATATLLVTARKPRRRRCSSAIA